MSLTNRKSTKIYSNIQHFQTHFLINPFSLSNVPFVYYHYCGQKCKYQKLQLAYNTNSLVFAFYHI